MEEPAGLVKVKQVTRWEISFNGKTLNVPKKLVSTIGGEVFFKLQATHSGTVHLISGSSLGTNPSMAQSQGFAALKVARNIASGIMVNDAEPGQLQLLVQAHSAHSHDDDQPDGSEQPPGSTCGRSKRRKMMSSSSSSRSGVVTFEVPEAAHIGAVTTKRASLVDEAIWIPMDEGNIENIFQIIKFVGLECDAKRNYTKSGKFKKTKTAVDSEEEEQEASEEVAGEHASDGTAGEEQVASEAEAEA